MNNENSQGGAQRFLVVNSLKASAERRIRRVNTFLWQRISPLGPRIILETRCPKRLQGAIGYTLPKVTPNGRKQSQTTCQHLQRMLTRVGDASACGMGHHRPQHPKFQLFQRGPRDPLDCESKPIPQVKCFQKSSRIFACDAEPGMAWMS
jgi:hypothetical protein